MDMKKLSEDRSWILSEMEKDITKNMVPAQLSDPNEAGFRVLTALLQDVAMDGLHSSGEFFFLPSNEDDELQFFVNLVTICEHVPDECPEQLVIALAAINTYVLTGAFAFDPVAKTLIYKLTSPMPIETPKEEMFEKSDLSMGLALQMVSDYAYMLVEVVEGTRTAESVIRFFTTMEH